MTNAEIHSDLAHFVRIPGGRHKARQNDDGTWDILDVSVFSTVPKGVKGAPKDITEDDLRSALAIHHRLFRDDDFCARVNVLHNQGIHKAIPAGFFLPKHVKFLRLKGERKAVVFADLIHVPDEVFQRIERNELPYRSVEVREWEPLEFGALSLLDTEPPFYQLPMMIGEHIAKARAVETCIEISQFGSDEGPAVAAFVCDQGSHFLFRFAEADMPEDEDKKDEAEFEGDGGVNVEAIVSAIEDGTIMVKDFAAIKTAMETAAGPEEVAEEEVPEDTTGKEPVEFEGDEEEEKKPAPFNAEAEGRIARLEDFRDETLAEKAQDAIFKAGLKSLKDDGFHITESTEAKLRRAAAAGEKTFKLFTDTYRETAMQDPPQTLTGGAGHVVENLPDEVNAYMNTSPEAFSAAKQEWNEWSDIPDDKNRSPLGRYLERNLKKKGVI